MSHTVKLIMVLGKGDDFMTSNEVRIEFMELIKREFPLVKFKEKEKKSGDLRISPYIINNQRNKRWMQLDANPNTYQLQWITK